MKSEHKNKIKYYAYLRKSSEDKERQALSIPAQKTKILETFPDLDIEFIEESKSAFIPYNRPLFSGMLEKIGSGDRRGLIVWHPDRLSRNEIDAASLTYMVRTNQIQDLKFVAYHFDNTPEGIWMLQMALSQSQYDSAKKGRDVKRGLGQKAGLGVFPGPAPLGHLNFTDEKGIKGIKTDTERFPLLRRMIDLMLTGTYTPPKILNIVNKEWGFKTPQGKPMSRSTIYNILTRPFGYGIFEYPVGSGKWHKGTHEPLMTEEEFDKIQFLLGREGRPRPKKHIFDFIGMMKCAECGCMITAETKMKKQKNGNVHIYIYYHCTKRKNPQCTQGSIEQDELEKQIDLTIDSLEIPPEFHTFAMKWFKAEHEKESTSRTSVLESQQKGYNAAVRKIDNLIDMRANGELTEQEFLERKTRAQEEKDNFKKALGNTDQRVEKWLEAADDMLLFITHARDKFKNGSMETRRRILSTLGSNLLIKDKKLIVNLAETLLPMPECAKYVKQIKERLEPLDTVEKQKDFEALCLQNPSLLRDLDSNQDTLLQRQMSYH